MRGGKCPRVRGFTLIEMMIVIAIIGLVSAISISSMSGTKAKSEVAGNARALAAAIREAQNYALTGKSIDGNTPCRFQVSISSGSYSVKQSDTGSCSSYSGTAVGFLNGVTASANQSVSFDVPRGEVRNASETEITSGSVDFSLTKGGETAHVCVYPLGRVEDKSVNTGC